MWCVSACFNIRAIHARATRVHAILGGAMLVRATHGVRAIPGRASCRHRRTRRRPGREHTRREVAEHRPREAAVRTLALPAHRLRPESRCLRQCRRAPTRRWTLPTRQDRMQLQRFWYSFSLLPRTFECDFGDYGSKCRRECWTQVKRRCEIGNAALLASAYRVRSTSLGPAVAPWGTGRVSVNVDLHVVSPLPLAMNGHLAVWQ